MSVPDFGALAPYGLQTVLDMRDGFADVQVAFADFLNSSLIALANDDRSINEKSKSTVWRDLTTALQAFQATSIVPIDSMRDLSSYSKLFGQIVPEKAGIKPADIAAALRTVASRWVVTNTKAYNEGCVTTKENLAKVGTAISPVSTSFDAVASFMQNSLDGTLGSADTQWKKLSMFELFEKAFKPLVTVKADRDGMFRINSTLGLSLTKDQYDETFAELIKSDKVTAENILAAITVFNGTVRLLLTQLATSSIHITGLSASYAGLLMAKDHVLEGIKTFARSIDSASSEKKQTEVIDRESIVKGWAVVGNNADLYVRDVGSLSPASRAARGAELFDSAQRQDFSHQRLPKRQQGRILGSVENQDPSEGKEKTPQEIKDAFGPPAYSASAITDLAAETVTIQGAFDSLLTVPYADTLVIKMENGSETKLRDMVLNMQKKYQALQARTLPVARDLNTAAALQAQLLPKVNQPNQLTLSQYLTASLQIVLAYQKSAKTIVKDTTELRDEYKSYLDILNRQLTEIEKEITSTESELDKAEKAYMIKILTTCIEFVIGAAFGIAAVALLITGVGTPFAVPLGIAATVSIGKGIADAVDAGTQATIINGLKDILSSLRQTKGYLEDAIPKLSLIVDLMTNISDIWTDIVGDLDDIEKHENLWNNPIYFTQDMISDTVQSWKDVGTACEAYGKIVGGLAPPTVATFWSDPAFENKVFANMILDPSMVTDEPPPIYSTYAQYPFAVRLAFENQAQDQLLDFLSAPNVSTDGLRKSELDNTASAWKSAGQALWSIGQEGIANDCTKLGLLLEDTVASSMSLAVKRLLEFAGPQPSLPVLPADSTQWRQFCDEKLAKLTPGLQQATICDTVLRNLQNQARLVANTCIAKRSEFESQFNAKRDELRRAEEEYNSYRWLIYIPSPIALIIAGLLELIRKDREQIAYLQGQLRQLDNALEKLEGTMNLIGRLFKYTASLSEFWASLTTKINTATGLWTVLDKFPALEVDLARQTWKTVEDAFQDWN